MSAHDDVKQATVPRCFIRRFDERYAIPREWNVIRVLWTELVPNNDGGTGTHYVYVCLAEEAEQP